MHRHCFPGQSGDLGVREFLASFLWELLSKWEFLSLEPYLHLGITLRKIQKPMYCTGTEFTLGTSTSPYMLYTPCESLVSGRTEVTDSSKKARFLLPELSTYRAQVENFLLSATSSLAAGRLCPVTYNGGSRAGLELCHRGCGGRGHPDPREAAASYWSGVLVPGKERHAASLGTTRRRAGPSLHHPVKGGAPPCSCLGRGPFSKCRENCSLSLLPGTDLSL